MQESLRIKQKSLQGWRNHFDNAKPYIGCCWHWGDGYHTLSRQKSITRWFDYRRWSVYARAWASQSVGWCYQNPRVGLILLGRCKPAGGGRAGSVLSDLCAVTRVCSLISRNWPSQNALIQIQLSVSFTLSPFSKICLRLKIKLIQRLLQPIDLKSLKPSQSENPPDLAGKTPSKQPNIPFTNWCVFEFACCFQAN